MIFVEFYQEKTYGKLVLTVVKLEEDPWSFGVSLESLQKCQKPTQKYNQVAILLNMVKELHHGNYEAILLLCLTYFTQNAIESYRRSLVTQI